MFICKICGKEFNNINGLSKHLNMLHNIKLLNYYITYEDLKIPTCPYCNKNSKIRTGISFQVTCGDDSCISKCYYRKHNDETKKKISNKRLDYLKNNQNKHPWKNNKKFISKPCEYFKNILNKNDIQYVSEYSPLYDRNFSIDIVLLNKKIGIEINGNQHYNNDKTLKSYYQNRKVLIEKEGWKLYDIHYSNVYKQEFINKIISYLKEDIKILSLDFSFDFNIKKDKTLKCKNCDKELKFKNSSGLCRNCYCMSTRLPRPPYDELLNNVTNFGYSKTSRIYNVTEACIRKWVKNYN